MAAPVALAAGTSRGSRKIMNLLAETSLRAADAGAGFRFRFPYRPFETSQSIPASGGRQPGFTVTLTPGIGSPAAEGLRAGRTLKGPA